MYEITSYLDMSTAYCTAKTVLKNPGKKEERKKEVNPGWSPR
jgi:hypothetical protein